MREILFRAKETRSGEWVEGYLVKAVGGKCMIIPVTAEHCGGAEFNKAYLCDPATVSQYTGLIDWGGKNVFEGDIVHLDQSVKETFNVTDGPVKYNGGAFFVNGEGGLLESLFVLADIRYVLRGFVIGNIHDNPNLLKQED